MGVWCSSSCELLQAAAGEKKRASSSEGVRLELISTRLSSSTVTGEKSLHKGNSRIDQVR